MTPSCSLQSMQRTSAFLSFSPKVCLGITRYSPYRNHLKLRLESEGRKATLSLQHLLVTSVILGKLDVKQCSRTKNKHLQRPGLFASNHVLLRRLFYIRTKALNLSAKVFSTKILIGDTIFTSSTTDGTSILQGHPNHAKV